MTDTTHLDRIIEWLRRHPGRGFMEAYEATKRNIL